MKEIFQDVSIIIRYVTENIEFVATRLNEIRQILDAVAGSGEEASDGESEPEETPSAVLSPPPTNQSNKLKNLQQVFSLSQFLSWRFFKTFFKVSFKLGAITI